MNNKDFLDRIDTDKLYLIGIAFALAAIILFLEVIPVVVRYLAAPLALVGILWGGGVIKSFASARKSYAKTLGLLLVFRFALLLFAVFGVWGIAAFIVLVIAWRVYKVRALLALYWPIFKGNLQRSWRGEK